MKKDACKDTVAKSDLVLVNNVSKDILHHADDLAFLHFVANLHFQAQDLTWCS